MSHQSHPTTKMKETDIDRERQADMTERQKDQQMKYKTDNQLAKRRGTSEINKSILNKKTMIQEKILLNIIQKFSHM